MNLCIQCGGPERSRATGRYCLACYSKRHNLTRKLRTIKMRKKLFDDLGGRCGECGNDDIRVLDCHHINPKLKSKKLKKNGLYRDALTKLYIYRTEIDNLQLICANCHRIHNYETIWKSKYDLN